MRFKPHSMILMYLGTILILARAASYAGGQLFDKVPWAWPLQVFASGASYSAQGAGSESVVAPGLIGAVVQIDRFQDGWLATSSGWGGFLGQPRKRMAARC